MLFVYSSKESATKGISCFDMFRDFMDTPTNGSWNRILTVSKISLVVSAAFCTVFSSEISFGYIELTAYSAR